MYNEERKKRFIQYKTENAKYDNYFIKGVLSKMEPFEEDLNKDACNFTTAEIENAYKTLNFVSSNSISMFNSVNSSYTSWCFLNGYVFDVQNHYGEFTVARLGELINKYIRDAKIVDREKVLNWCWQLPNASDKFLLLGLFEGIGGRDYINFTDLVKSDINIDDCTIDLADRGKVKFSKELCYLGLDAAEEQDYYTLKSNGERIVKMIRSDKVIKDNTNARDNPTQFRKGRRIYSWIKRVFVFLGIDAVFKPGDISDSGIIYYINEQSKELNISGEKFLRNNEDKIREQFGRNIRWNNFYRLYKDFLA